MLLLTFIFDQRSIEMTWWTISSIYSFTFFTIVLSLWFIALCISTTNVLAASTLLLRFSYSFSKRILIRLCSMKGS